MCRLRYGGSATRWGFGIYLASKDGFADAPQDALDCAYGLYLNSSDI